VNLEFKKSFAKDLKKKAKDATLRSRVQEVIQQVDDADRVDEIRNLKKLRAEGNYYRVRLGDYRIGLTIEADTVCFVRCLHRSEIYRYFP